MGRGGGSDANKQIRALLIHCFEKSTSNRLWWGVGRGGGGSVEAEIVDVSCCSFVCLMNVFVYFILFVSACVILEYLPLFLVVCLCVCLLPFQGGCI